MPISRLSIGKKGKILCVLRVSVVKLLVRATFAFITLLFAGSKDDLTYEGIETSIFGHQCGLIFDSSKDDLTDEGMNGGAGRKAKGEEGR